MRLRLLLLGLSSLLAIGVSALDATPDEPAAAAAAAAADADDNAPHELICHTSDPSECYPRVFVATHEFQVVRDDQAVPAGLHIRVDMQDGRKEAKLVDAAEEEEDAATEAVEVFAGDGPGSAVGTVAEQGVRDEEVQVAAEKVLEQMRMARAAGAGAVKVPVGATGERARFDESVGHVVRYATGLLGASQEGAYGAGGEDAVLGSLDELEDLCHDIYWGLELVRSDFATAVVPRMVSDRGTRSALLQSKMVMVLATALRNNAAALDRLEEHYERHGHDAGAPPSYVQVAFSSLNDPEHDLKTITRPVSLLSALLPRERFFREFLRRDGPAALRLVLDRFVQDGEAGAETRGPSVERLFDRVDHLFRDHLFNEQGKQRLERWGKDLEQVVTKKGYEWQAGESREEQELAALCEHLEDTVQTWNFALDRSQAHDEMTGRDTAAKWEPGVCRTWRRLRETWAGKSEL